MKKIGSYSGNLLDRKNQLIMGYSVFSTTYSKNLTAEAGEIIHVKIVAEEGSLDIKIRKEGDKPVFERDNISDSVEFDVEIHESGIYKTEVTGKKARGSVSFVVEKRKF